MRTTLQTLARTYTGDRLPAIAVDGTLHDASELMKAKGIDHLPVILEDGTIVGLLAEREIPHVEKTALHGDSLVREYMTWPVDTLDETSPISEAARVFLERKCTAIFITRDEQIHGLVTVDDLLRHLAGPATNELRARADELEAKLYNSPVGSIAQVLADAGL